MSPTLGYHLPPACRRVCGWARFAVYAGLALIVILLVRRSKTVDLASPAGDVRIWREWELPTGAPVADLWFELCRGLSDRLADAWCAALASRELPYVRQGDVIIVWQPVLEEACDALGPVVSAQWVSISRRRSPAETEEMVKQLGPAKIDARLVNGELCVRRKDRVEAMDLLRLPRFSDVYFQVDNSYPEDNSQFEELTQFLKENELDGFFYPPWGQTQVAGARFFPPRGLCVRGGCAEGHKPYLAVWYKVKALRSEHRGDN
jgi:hypothetical protein